MSLVPCLFFGLSVHVSLLGVLGWGGVPAGVGFAFLWGFLLWPFHLGNSIPPTPLEQGALEPSGHNPRVVWPGVWSDRGSPSWLEGTATLLCHRAVVGVV